MTCGDIFSFNQLQYDTDVRAAYDLSLRRGGPPNLVVTNMHEEVKPSLQTQKHKFRDGIKMLISMDYGCHRSESLSLEG